jgi:hypothetical protein
MRIPPVIDLGLADRLDPALSGERARKLWSMVLLLAVKDLATVVRYEPNRGERSLSYRVNGIYHDLVAPPVHMADILIDEIERMAGRVRPPRLLPGALRRLVRGQPGPADRLQKALVELKVGDQFVDAIVTIEPTRAGRRVVVYLVDGTAVSETASAASGRAMEVFRRMNRARHRDRRHPRRGGGAAKDTPL